MISSTDLRIGNLVEFPDKTIRRIGLTDLYEGLNTYCTPVDLTEKWLLKLDINAKSFFNGNLHKLGFGYNYIVMGHKVCYLQYVHQLQNLCYLLSGKELTIKE